MRANPVHVLESGGRVELVSERGASENVAYHIYGGAVGLLTGTVGQPSRRNRTNASKQMNIMMINMLNMFAQLAAQFLGENSTDIVKQPKAVMGMENATSNPKK